MSWGKGNWGEQDKALAEEAEQARYEMQRAHRKSTYRALVFLLATATTSAFACYWAASTVGNLP